MRGRHLGRAACAAPAASEREAHLFYDAATAGNIKPPDKCWGGIVRCGSDLIAKTWALIGSGAANLGARGPLGAGDGQSTHKQRSGRPELMEGLMIDRVSRRGMFAAIAALTATIGWRSRALAAVPVGYYKVQKVVYHNDGGGSDKTSYFAKLLNSIRNHIQAVGEANIELRVVDHGPGVDLLSLAQSDRDLASRMDELRGKHVRFLVCANTLRERKIDWRSLHGVKEDDIVPSGVAELARLQGMSFAYIHL